MKFEWKYGTAFAGEQTTDLMFGNSIKGTYTEKGGKFHVEKARGVFDIYEYESQARQAIVESYKQTLKSQLEALDKL